MKDLGQGKLGKTGEEGNCFFFFWLLCLEVGFLSLMEKRGCFSIKKKKRKKRERERFENFKIFTGTGPPLGSWLPQLQPTVRKTAEIDIHEKSKNCILNIHFKCSH